QKPYKSILKDLREYGAKYASRAYSDNYAIGNTESEDSKLKDEHNSDLKS
ncbi:13514_t:CDS:2, partial [Funneliformis mosseae]